MQKTILSLALIALVSASASDFPSFDMMHANCAMKVTYQNMKCPDEFSKLEATIKSFNPDPAQGVYAVKEESTNDYVWTTRTTPVHKYVDDIIFQLTQSGPDCVVNAKSRSQTMSYYDYDTNYCNMWNVLSRSGTITDLSTSECKWVPDDITTTCAKY